MERLQSEQFSGWERHQTRWVLQHYRPQRALQAHRWMGLISWKAWQTPSCSTIVYEINSRPSVQYCFLYNYISVNCIAQDLHPQHCKRTTCEAGCAHSDSVISQQHCFIFPLISSEFVPEMLFRRAVIYWWLCCLSNSIIGTMGHPILHVFSYRVVVLFDCTITWTETHF